MKRLVVVALLASCYSPVVKDGQFKCEKSSACPADFNCLCGLCRAPGVDAGACNPSDGGQPPDMTGVVKRTDGCTLPLMGGATGRGEADPNLERLAFCPAAWRVPGIVSAAGKMTPCNRMPRGNGRNMNDTIDCSAEDNCAPGWHVCRNEAEIVARGLTKAMCDAVASAPMQEFYGTGQPAGPMVPGQPPSCMVNQDRAILGCGNYGMGALVGCSVFSRCIIDMPGGGDECTTINAAWSCPNAGVTGGEANVVVKASGMGGGVMCCKD